MKKTSTITILNALFLLATILNFSASVYAQDAETTTTVDCSCDGGKLTNGSFESGSTGWTKSANTNFTKETAYKMCGSYYGLINGAGSIYQDVALAAGSTVSLTIYAGTHDTRYDHQIKLTFLDANNNAISTGSTSVQVNFDVGSQYKLQRYGLNGTAPSNAVKVRVEGYSSGNYLKMDYACLKITAPVTPPADCSCDGDRIANGSFEDGTNSWSKSTSGTSFKTETTYKVCGNYQGLISGSGGIYQDISLVAGSSLSFSAYAGTHNTGYEHKLKLTFYDGSNNVITTGSTSVEVDYNVGSGTALKKYVLNATAPAGAIKVRVEATSTGDYLKLDVLCLKVTQPSYCEDCTNNKLTNASFENGGTTGWSYEGKSFTAQDAYKVCGEKGGVLDGAGKFWQDVNLLEGSQVTLKIWGAYHVANGQKFQLVFLNASNTQVGSTVSVDIDKVFGNSPVGLKQYTLTGTAPAGSTKVRVQGVSNGNYIKVDAACLTIVEPTVNCNCDGNKLANAGFEEGTNGWTVAPNTNFFTDGTYKVCGTKYGVISGAGSIYQEFPVAQGNQVSLSIYGGTDNPSVGHQFKITFFNGSGGVIATNSQTIDVTFVPTSSLKEFTASASAPSGAISVRLEIVSSGNYFAFDAACLKITGALPVTLVDFAARKEGSTANLTWSTTAETNSSEFEIQHSVNGKSWSKVGSIAAKGESTVVVPYNFTHETPANGTNLYRLKMIDLDETFAFSKIVSLTIQLGEGLSIYPNPTADFVKLGNAAEAVSKVQLYNTQGRLILEAKPDSDNRVDLTRLTTGNYIVKINYTGGTVATSRVQIVR